MKRARLHGPQQRSASRSDDASVLRSMYRCTWVIGLLLLLGIPGIAQATPKLIPNVLFFGITRANPMGAEGGEAVRRLDRDLTTLVGKQLREDGGLVLLDDPCATNAALCETIGDAAMRAHAAQLPRRPDVLLRGKVELDRQNQPRITVILIDMQTTDGERSATDWRAPAFTTSTCARCADSQDLQASLAAEFTERVWNLLAAENLGRKAQRGTKRLRTARWPLLAIAATAGLLTGLAWVETTGPCTSDPSKLCANQLSIRTEWTATQASIGVVALLGYGAIEIYLNQRPASARKDSPNAL